MHQGSRTKYYTDTIHRAIKAECGRDQTTTLRDLIAI